MVSALNSSSLRAFSTAMQSALSDIQTAVHNIFSQAKIELERIKDSLDLKPLEQPGNLIEGIWWTGFWGVCAAFTVTDLQGLRESVTVELPSHEKFVKIGIAVKKVFLDIVSLAGATLYNVFWAHELKIISLGQLAPLFKALGYGSSLIYNIIDGGWSVYQLCQEKEEMRKATNPYEKDYHQQRFSLALMKVIGNVTMAAWTALGIATFATGFAVSSAIMTTMLLTGCVLSIAAFTYQIHLDKTRAPRPAPQISLA
jgi:hypothetical protein